MKGKMKKFVILGFWVLILGFILAGCGNLFSTTATGPVISSWSFVDGNGANGINKDSSKSASGCELAVFNSRLYATWYEPNSIANQIQVAVYNGDDSNPSWSFVDGNGANGINKDSSKSASGCELIVLNSKLYATWSEPNSIANQIQVAVYNGDDSNPSWSFVDGNGANGINKDSSKSASGCELIVLNSKLYAAWVEANGTSYQIRAAVYNGDDNNPSWSFVDGNGAYGINKDSSKDAFYPQLIVFNSKLYATWYEFNGIAYQIRAAVYNGDDNNPSWSFVDGNGVNGINKDSLKTAKVARSTVFNSKLYALWVEFNYSAQQLRVAVYNDDDSDPSWSFVDGNGANGINKDSSKNAGNSQLAVFNSRLYAIWVESNGVANQVRLAVYNGDDNNPSWSFVDGDGVNGINKDSSQYAHYPQLALFNSKLYASWSEFNDLVKQIRIAVFK